MTTSAGSPSTPAFTERLGSALVLVPPLTEAELREVVRGPAAAVGLTVEDELARRRRRRRPRPAGGAAAALDRAGRHVGAPPGGPAHARRIPGGRRCHGVAEPVGGGRLRRCSTRRAGRPPGACSSGWPTPTRAGRSSGGRCPLAELDLDGDRGTVRRTVVDGFVARRLLSLDGERLDVAHEALLTGWPRLARWLEDDAAGRAVRRHLTPAAQEWQRRGRPDDELYRGARLGAALDWAAAADDELTAGGAASSSTRPRRAPTRSSVAAEPRARPRPDGRRRLRWLAAGLAGVLVVALVDGRAGRARPAAADRASAVAEAPR